MTNQQQREYQRQWREKHPHYHRDWMRRWRANDENRISEKLRPWYCHYRTEKQIEVMEVKDGSESV